MTYKTELHTHTKDVSPCSDQSAECLAEKYIKSGYTSLTLTNHASVHTFNWAFPGRSWEEQVDGYFDAIEKVRAAAGDRMFVIDGMEADVHGSDFLVIGVDRDIIKKAGPELLDYEAEQYHEFTKANGLLFIKAHPLRPWERLYPPYVVDGYEVFNGHPANPSRNDIAEAFVNHFNRGEKLILTSGTDNHDEWMQPDAGIITDVPIKDSKQLAEILRSGDYELIKTDMQGADY